MKRKKSHFIQEWREKCGLSKAEAARALGISEQAYSYVEKHDTIKHVYLRVMATVWSEKTEAREDKFYEWYHSAIRV